MKKIFLVLLAMMFAISIKANDASFYMSGNTLVPVKETDISVAKEILTITIGRDGYAKVDVYYEFFNPKRAKTVTMAFEADPPAFLGQLQNRDGKHPYIKDFTVTMNDVALECKNAIIEKKYGDQKDFKPLDMDEWIGNETSDEEPFCDANELYNEKEDRWIRFSYGYFFTAEFKKGLNTVHHTYSYHMNDNFIADYVIEYWLTPATRWAGGKIGDFTLRLKSEQYGEEICMVDSLFMGEPWKAPFDQYFVQHPNPYVNDVVEHFMLARLEPDRALEWHTTDFAPDRNLQIFSANYIKQRFRYNTSGTVVVDDNTGDACVYVAEDETRYLVEAQDYGWMDKSTSHIEIRSAEKGQGCITSISNEPVYVRLSPSKNAEVIQVIGVAEDIPDSFECLGYCWVWDDGSHSWFIANVYGIKGYVNADKVMWEPYNIKVPEPPYDFYNYDDPTSVIIPEGITFIETATFYNCKDVKTVSIPNSVTFIGARAFEGCTGLETVTLSEGMKAIDPWTFKNCSSLTKVVIPAGISRIQAEAFSGCNALTSIICNNPTPPIIFDNSFSSSCYKATLYVPQGFKKAYQSARIWKNFKNIVEMPLTVNQGYRSF